jgi:HEAT repeat protein
MTNSEQHSVEIPSNAEGTSKKLLQRTVFLSYAWNDQRFVLAVDQWLRNRGMNVLLDYRNFAPGRNINDEILRWIAKAAVIVCFFSRHSRNRPYPKLEREIAHSRQLKGKAILIYFCLDETPVDKLAKEMLYIPAHKLTFADSVEKLWQGIFKNVRPASKIDLNPFLQMGADWTRLSELTNEASEAIRSENRVQALVTLLSSPDKEDAEFVIRRLPKIGLAAKSAIPYLVDQFQGASDTGYQDRIIGVLTAIGGSKSLLLPSILGQLKETQLGAHATAGAPPKVDTRSVTGAFCEALLDSVTQARMTAIEKAGQIGADADEAVPVIATALFDDHIGVRLAAALAIKKIKGDDVSGIPSVKDVYKDERYWDNRIIARIFRGLGPKVTAFVDEATGLPFMEVLVKVRKEIAKAIGNHPDALEFGPAFARALRDNKWNWFVKRAKQLGRGAKKSVVKIENTVKDALIETLNEADPRPLIFAMGVLGAAGPEVRKAVPAIRRKLYNENEDVRVAAIRALGNIGGSRAKHMIASYRCEGSKRVIEAIGEAKNMLDAADKEKSGGQPIQKA